MPEERKAISKISKIWLPLLIFLSCLSALFSSELLVEQFGKNLSAVARNTFVYGVQIGVWISAAYLLNRMIEIFFWDGFVAKVSERKVPRLPKDVTFLAIFTLAGMGITATVFDRSITGILATSGVASVIIGLALRNIILDMFIGLAIHVERPFKIGDWIQIHRRSLETHVIAKVIEINWRTTRLKTTENNMIVIPNNVIGTSILTNYMEPKPHFRIDLPFTIDFDIPSERASRVLEAGIRAIAGEHGILETPEPEVRLKEATLEGQRFEVRYFILPAHISPNESKDLVNRSVLEHLNRSGIAPSKPKEQVYLHKEAPKHLDTSNNNDIYELLSRTELFSKLSIDELMDVFSGMKRRELGKGDVLYRQGERGETMFLLLEGLLHSSIMITGQDKPARVESIKAGSHFGEQSVMFGTTRPSTVEASTQVIVYEIAKDQMKSILAKRGDLLSMLNDDIAESTSKISTKTKAVTRRKKAAAKKEPTKKGVKKSVQTFFNFF